MSSIKIAILGANENVNKLICKAKSLGYETHVFAWQCGDPGETSADFFYPISIVEKEAILAQCRAIGIHAITSVASDVAVPTVNFVAREMGLVGNSPRTDVVARNKYLMREAIRDAGLYTPWFYRADKTFTMQDAADFVYPLIVKPTDRWGSKGITRVDSPDALEAAVAYAQQESLEGAAIIEGFMEGEEYSCECICYHGTFHALQITKKQTTGCPHYVETGHEQPAGLSAETASRVVETIRRAAAALDIQNSAAHAEFRILADGTIGIVEVGARMGGDCIGTDLVMLSTGYDYLRMVLQVALDIAPDFTKAPHYATAKVTFPLTADDLATYHTHKASGKILKEYGICEQFAAQTVDSSTRNGYYIVVTGEQH